MADISQLKKNKKSTEDLKSKLQGQGQKESFQDERFWYPERDKETGSASALIRFLPEPPGEDMPWVKNYKHFFKTPSGKWFVQECPTTIGRNCPVCEANSELWNTGDESNKEIARKRKRQLGYTANVLVKDDAQNPENNGTVRLLKFGQQIFDIIQQAISPEFEDDNPVNVFDPWDGADFKFRIRKVQGQVNYQKSVFDEVSALGTDEEIEEIWKKEHSLEQFHDPNMFLSYEELERKFKDAMGQGASGDQKQDFPGHEETRTAEAETPAKSEPEESAPSVSADEGSVGKDEDDDVLGEIDDLLSED